MSATAPPTTAPRPGRPLYRLVALFNLPMRGLLALPFSTPLARRLMLLHLTGRRTGRHYRMPVSYVEHEGTLLTPGGGRWRLNLVDGRAERVRLRGRDVWLVPELVDDLDEVNRLLRVMVAHNAMVGRFVAIPREATGDFDRERLSVALDHGFRVIRWRRAA